MTPHVPRPYAVMVDWWTRPPEAVVTYEPLVERAECERRLGWTFIADHPGYHPAAERAAAFNALPAEERWWAASWASRAREDTGA